MQTVTNDTNTLVVTDQNTAVVPDEEIQWCPLW